MAATKVLVVDDSLTMRALISNTLGRIPGVEVVGAADGAAEARGMIEKFKPHVLTLDIEMPGMSGLEYLAELMEQKPIPVIMFSTRTEAGAESSIEALRLGAVDCFPKPKAASQSEFDAIIGKLGKRIQAAKGTTPVAGKAVAVPARPLNWNGRLLAIGADSSGTQRLFNLCSTFSDSCQPTVIIQHLGEGLVESMARKLDEKVAPKVVVATDGMALEQGHIYFAPQGDKHLVVDAWPNGRLRLLPRDPIAGERPSISLLLLSIAKANADGGIGLLLSDGLADGPQGMKALQEAGGRCLNPDSDGFVLTRNATQQRFPADKLWQAVFQLCGQ